MNPSNQRLIVTLVALAASVAATPTALAAPNPATAHSNLSTYEYVINPDYRYLYTNVTHQDSGTGTLRYHYSDTPQPSPFNTAAYVDPATGKMRAFAFSDASELGSVAVEPPFNISPSNDRSAAGVTVSYTKKLTITPGSTSLLPGDPVKLALTFHLDGRLSIGGTVHDPAPIYSAAHMGASFNILDRAVDTGSEAIYELVNFSASAEKSKSVINPGGTSYPDGAQINSKTYKWSLTSNDPSQAPLGDYITDYYEDPYNYEGGSTIPLPFVHDFDTGLLTVTFDTYVGAVLDISSSLDVSTTSNALAYSPYASANFMNTFALDFAPAPGFEGLTLVSNALTPEPTTLSLLALAFPLAARRRRSR